VVILTNVAVKKPSLFDLNEDLINFITFNIKLVKIAILNLILLKAKCSKLMSFTGSTKNGTRSKHLY
jgi:hypothetical protein